ncbi:MAG TPA: L,D-transpeptidase, partial [Blastocatellia bacterium]|nr:L,D-transpeptidase [Blastocatellia bacterium]
NPLVPVVPASHGCIRIPMFAAKDFYAMATVGTIVLVYGDNGSVGSNRSLGKPADPLAVLPKK